MDVQPKRNWWDRNWKWVVPVGILVPIMACGGFAALILAIVFGAIKSSDAYTKSLAAVRADAQVQTALGTPIKPGYFVTGNINVSGPSGRADISYSVSGPKGDAVVYAVANKAIGQWTFQGIVVQVNATGNRLNIPPPP